MITKERPPPDIGWCVVVPVKTLDRAKSRLSTDPQERATLALCFAADTVAAALHAPSVLEVVVVTDDPTAVTLMRDLGATVIRDVPNAGLNPALRHGAAHAASRHRGCGIVALLADLPALRSADLALALGRAATLGAAVVPDVAATGTTAYFVAAGGQFVPRFGWESLRAHVESGATPLTDVDLPTLRRDVDTPADLASAVVLGVGPHTRAALATSTRRTQLRRSLTRELVRCGSTNSD